MATAAVNRTEWNWQCLSMLALGSNSGDSQKYCTDAVAQVAAVPAVSHSGVVIGADRCCWWTSWSAYFLNGAATVARLWVRIIFANFAKY